jgi:ethanolamine utilization protein EutA (predicted chaperonin)
MSALESLIGASLNVSAVVFSEVGKVALSYMRDMGFPTKIGRFDLAKILNASEASVDERLLKIDNARQNLSEALQAIEELADQAGKQKQELETLTAAVTNALNEKAAATDELAQIRGLVSLDTRAVRKALEVPTRTQRWLERFIAFAFGIGASFLASIIYEWWKSL